MERGALKRLAQIRKDDAKAVIDKYNSRVDAGDLDNFFADTKRQKKKIESKRMTADELVDMYRKK